MNNGKYCIDYDETNEYLASYTNMSPTFRKKLLKFIDDKNNGKYHRGIDHNLSLSNLKKKWSKAVD